MLLGIEERREKVANYRNENALRIICGDPLRDCINNETIRKITAVEKIEEFSKEQRLTWIKVKKK